MRILLVFIEFCVALGELEAVVDFVSESHIFWFIEGDVGVFASIDDADVGSGAEAGVVGDGGADDGDVVWADGEIASGHVELRAVAGVFERFE